MHQLFAKPKKTDLHTWKLLNIFALYFFKEIKMSKQFLLTISILLNINVHCQNFQWAKSMGGKYSDMGYSIFADASGNTYTVGSFFDTIDMDPNNGIAQLNSTIKASSMFITKMDANGNLIWAKSVGDSTMVYGIAITVDIKGNVYSTGQFRGTTDFDPGPKANKLTAADRDVFILKLDGDGNFIWVKSMTGTNEALGVSIAVDAEENVYTTGYFYSKVDFDPGVNIINIVSKGAADIFISKFNKSGNFVWVKQIGSFNEERASSIKIDNSGHLYLTGYFKDKVDFDPSSSVNNLKSNGLNDIFILKMDTAGYSLWAKNLGGSSSEQPSGLVLDKAGNVVVTGIFYTEADFDPGNGTTILKSSGSADIFIVKFDASGNLIWAKGLGTTNYEATLAIAVDASNNIFVLGIFKDTMDFDPGTDIFQCKSAGANDIFILKLDVNGNFVWAVNMGGKNEDFGYSISIDASGNIYCTGSFENMADFDPGWKTVNATSKGMNDIFIAKLNSDIAGSEKLSLSPNISLFPNPSKDFITINSHIFDADLRYLITDQTGKQILKGYLNSKSTNIEIKDLSPGLYNIQIGLNNKSIHKFFKL